MSKVFEKELIEALNAGEDIHLLGPEYVDWEEGDDDIVLDGRFTIKELQAIIGHVQETKKRKSKAPS